MQMQKRIENIFIFKLSLHALNTKTHFVRKIINRFDIFRTNVKIVTSKLYILFVFSLKPAAFLALTAHLNLN